LGFSGYDLNHYTSTALDILVCKDDIETHILELKSSIFAKDYDLINLVTNLNE